MPLWVVLLSVLLAMGSAVYVGLPVLVRRALWQVRPDCEPLADPAPTTAPRVGPAEFESVTKKLVAEGFELVDRRLLSGHGPGLGAYVAFLDNPATHVAAMAVSSVEFVAKEEMPRVVETYVELSTRFTDSVVVETNNSDRDPLYPPIGARRREQFPQVGEPDRLVRVHAALVASARPSAATVRTERADRAQRLGSGMVDQLAEQVQTGYLYFDRGQQAYLPTWRGAFLLTWKQSWPVKQIRHRLRRRRAGRLLHELGFEVNGRERRS